MSYATKIYFGKRERQIAILIAILLMLLTVAFLLLLKLTVPDPPLSTIPEPMEILVEAPPPAASGGVTSNSEKVTSVDPYKSPTQEEPSEVQAISSPEQNDGDQLVDAEPTPERQADDAFMFDDVGDMGEGGQGTGGLGEDTGFGNNGSGPGMGGNGNGSSRKIVQAGHKPVASRAGRVEVTVYIDAKGLPKDIKITKISIEDLRQPAIQKVKSMRWNEKPGQKGLEKVVLVIEFTES